MQHAEFSCRPYTVEFSSTLQENILKPSEATPYRAPEIRVFQELVLVDDDHLYITVYAVHKEPTVTAVGFAV